MSLNMTELRQCNNEREVQVRKHFYFELLLQSYYLNLAYECSVMFYNLWMKINEQNSAWQWNCLIH